MRQFSIRELLLLVAVVALALGWFFDRRPKPARFQMRVTTNYAFVFDTATGEVWEKKLPPWGTFTSGGDGGFDQPKFVE